MDRFKRIQMMCELLADDLPTRVDAVGHTEPVGFCLMLFYGDGTYAGATKAEHKLIIDVLRKYLALFEGEVAAANAAQDKDAN